MKKKTQLLMRKLMNLIHRLKILKVMAQPMIILGLLYLK